MTRYVCEHFIPIGAVCDRCADEYTEMQREIKQQLRDSATAAAQSVLQNPLNTTGG